MEIKRYQCIKPRIFDTCDDDGLLIESQSKQIEVGSIWRKGNNMIAGEKDNIHLDREDSPPGVAEWCEALRETFWNISNQSKVFKYKQRKRSSNGLLFVFWCALRRTSLMGESP